MKRLLIGLLKIGISAAIIAYLLIKAINDQAFVALREQPKNWWLLAGATGLCGAAVVLTHIRWYYLVRALHLPFRLTDAFRLGFLGYLFNLAPMGMVGGDLLKGVMLIRHVRGHRAKATASVVVDRVIGLYMLFVVASVAILVTRFWNRDQQVYSICTATLLLTAVGTAGLVVLFIPGVTGGRLTGLLGHMSRIGQILQRLIDAVRMYQQNLPMMLTTTMMSVGVHVLFVLGIYLIANGLYDRVAPLASHFVVVPLSAATGVLPLPIGPFEFVLELLYTRIGMPEHQGLIVALASRIVTVLIAIVGVCYYLGSRAEVAEVMHEADRQGSPSTIQSSPRTQ